MGNNQLWSLFLCFVFMYSMYDVLVSLFWVFFNYMEVYVAAVFSYTITQTYKIQDTKRTNKMFN